MPWTRFIKPYEHIYIEAPEAEARAVFFNRFNRNPDRVTCTCCGSDYSVSEEPTLEAITAYARNCDYDKKTRKYVERQEPGKMAIRKQCRTKAADPWGLYLTVDQYVKQPDVLLIRADEIKESERSAKIPAQGYVWVD